MSAAIWTLQAPFAAGNLLAVRDTFKAGSCTVHSPTFNRASLRMQKHHAVVASVAAFLFAASAAAQDFPAVTIAGRWTADAQMSATVSGGTKPGYWWVGRINASIERAGRVLVTADNGCRVSGLAMPLASNQGFHGLANVTDCPDPEMNRRYTLFLSGAGKPNLSMALTAVVNNPSGNLNYEIRGVMMRALNPGDTAAALR